MSSSPSSLREELADMLVGFAGQGRTLTIQRPYLDLCDGDHLKALFFSQLLYWSGKGKWFYKSYTDWYSETGLSSKQVRRITKELCDEGIVETAVSQVEGAPTTHYRVCGERFGDWIVTKKNSVRLCPEGTFEYALREGSNMPSGNNHPYVTLESVQEKHTLDSSVGSVFGETPLGIESIKWVGQRFRAAGRKLGTADRRVMSEWLGELQHSEEEVEAALKQFFQDTYWREKNYPPDAFRKQFLKYLEASTWPVQPAAAPALVQTPALPKPVAPIRDFVAEWNALVPASPVKSRDVVVTVPPECAADQVFCERFAEVCEIAQKIHKLKGEQTWLTFRWVVRKKAGEEYGWWRLLTDMRGMSVEPKSNGQRLLDIA